MAEFIFVITELYSPNSDDFAHRISGSQVLSVGTWCKHHIVVPI